MSAFQFRTRNCADQRDLTSILRTSAIIRGSRCTVEDLVKCCASESEPDLLFVLDPDISPPIPSRITLGDTLAGNPFASMPQLLLAAGADDSTWPSDELSAALDELRDARLFFDGLCDKWMREQRKAMSEGELTASTP